MGETARLAGLRRRRLGSAAARDQATSKARTRMRMRKVGNECERKAGSL